METTTVARDESKAVELTFPVPWGIIAAKAFGVRSFAPVFVVHGLMDNCGSFDRLMALLPKTFYYVSIDLPGHGKSTKFPNGIYLDFMLYVSAIRRVIVHLGWTKFCYIGHSLGGQLGSYYAALYPQEISKLVILDILSQLTVSLDGFVKYHREYFKQLLEVEKKLESKNTPNYSYEEALGRIINHRPYQITKEAAEALIKRALKEEKNNTYSFAVDQRLKFGVRTAMTAEQHLSIVSKIQCPVLLVITKAYLYVVENHRKNNYEALTLELFRKKPNFRIVPVEGQHDVHNNEPDVVAPYISKFLLEQKSVL